MLILVSGEGVTDMGECRYPASDQCRGEAFEAGPVAWLLDRILEARKGRSFLTDQQMVFVAKPKLSERSKALRPPTLPGRKRRKETAYFFKNARALAQLAQELAAQEDDNQVVAVLFRDADGTRSSKRREWQDKWDAMIKGFEYEKFDSGVPMLPNPKSEAWLLCALKKDQPYRHCERIEAESGNDKGANPLKEQLEQALGKPPNAELLTELVREGKIDPNRIRMPSFDCFKERLQQCLGGSRKPYALRQLDT